jgi:hypothetical protein
MNRIVHWQLAVVLIAGTLLLGSCRQPGQATARGDASEPPRTDSAAPATGIEGAGESLAPEELPERIYYDLTRFDWYTRGGPLRFEKRAYWPRGEPLRASLSSMRKTGEFEGVDYYRAESAPEGMDVVYVPVFEGFWLAFVHDTPSARTP